ncbi:unnamed protein product [Effrenium voratum]|nr:unnamed protein product [Effrenium voratum]
MVLATASSWISTLQIGLRLFCATCATCATSACATCAHANNATRAACAHSRLGGFPWEAFGHVPRSEGPREISAVYTSRLASLEGSPLRIRPLALCVVWPSRFCGICSAVSERLGSTLAFGLASEAKQAVRAP